ncbi:TPA: hypothetical protein ACPVXB_001027 [Vibrio parahaemolyticus]
MFVNISGSWKKTKTPYVNVSGSWKAAKKVFVNVSGTWKEAWVSFTHTLTVGSTSYYGEFVYGFSLGSSTYQNHGAITPSKIDAGTVVEMVADEGAQRGKIRLSSPLSDTEIEVVTEGGSKFVFVKASTSSAYYNLSGSYKPWRDFLYSNIGKSVKLTITTF